MSGNFDMGENKARKIVKGAMLRGFKDVYVFHGIKTSRDII